MTNVKNKYIYVFNQTRITDVEIVERRYPVRIEQFTLRENSGGNGFFKGGDGIIREYKFLHPLTVSLLTERRVFAPFGMFGGSDGQIIYIINPDRKKG